MSTYAARSAAKRAEMERLAALMEEWREDPVLFVQDVLGAEPDEWQAKFLRSVAVKDRTAVRSGHGVGKSTGVAWLVLWYAHTHRPFKMPITGSNFDQLQATTWAEVGYWLKKMPPSFQAAWDYNTVALKLRDAPEECFAVIRTASKEKSQNLAGFHSENVLVLVDEASAVDEDIFTVLAGALTTAGSKMVMTGNPTQASGKFYRAFHEERALWHTMHISCLDTPRVSPAWVEEQKAAYGEHSNVYRVRVLGDFPTSDDDGVVPLSAIESAVGRDVVGVDIRPIWGLDVARFGDDSTALAKRQGNVQLEPIKEWRGKDVMQVVGLIHREWIETPQLMRPAEIVVDAIGIGAGVADGLKLEGLPVRACNVAESAASSNFHRQRDELWWKCREWFLARDCRFCDDQATMGELAGPRYDYLPNNKLKVESKDDMKKRGVKSPNRADSWVLTFAGNPHSRRASNYDARPSRAELDGYGWNIGRAF